MTSKFIEKVSDSEAIEAFSLCLLSTEFTDDGNFGNTLMDTHVVRKLVLDVYVCYKSVDSESKQSDTYKTYDLDTNVELIEVVTGGDILLNGV